MTILVIHDLLPDWVFWNQFNFIFLTMLCWSFESGGVITFCVPHEDASGRNMAFWLFSSTYWLFCTLKRRRPFTSSRLTFIYCRLVFFYYFRNDIILLRSERDKLGMEARFAEEKLARFLKEFEQQVNLSGALFLYSDTNHYTKLINMDFFGPISCLIIACLFMPEGRIWWNQGKKCWVFSVNCWLPKETPWKCRVLGCCQWTLSEVDYRGSLLTFY